jgi:hypothetical protein
VGIRTRIDIECLASLGGGRGGRRQTREPAVTNFYNFLRCAANLLVAIRVLTSAASNRTMSATTKFRKLGSVVSISDVLYLAAAAFPTWALLASSMYLMLVARLHSLDIRRFWNA